MPDLLSILAQSSGSLAAIARLRRRRARTSPTSIRPGTSRQTANLEALTPAELVANGFIGRGVDVQSITQARTPSSSAQIPNAVASKGWTSTESDALSAVSALDPEAAGGLGSALSKLLFVAARGLAEPGRPGAASRGGRGDADG